MQQPRTDSEIPALPILLYDGDCVLCCQLAAWVAKATVDRLTVLSWQSFVNRPTDCPPVPGVGGEEHRPSSLYVWDQTVWLRDGPAWEYVLEQHPSLRGLHWLAQKLGLSPQAGRLAAGAGSWVRRWCRSCRRSY